VSLLYVCIVTRTAHRIPDEILNDVLLQKAISQVKTSFVIFVKKLMYTSHYFAIIDLTAGKDTACSNQFHF